MLRITARILIAQWPFLNKGKAGEKKAGNVKLRILGGHDTF